ncbi:MAG: RNB domain-containing ribonuclease, partial [Gammaproteobacteria bacterium]|nr:RNB domain-containing ribonuclease [Gammaproteobacteria bacterium]
MLSGYYRIERLDQGLAARKLFVADEPVFSRRPEFSAFTEGAIVLVADEPVDGDRISLLAEGGTAKARVWTILDDYAVDPHYPDAVHKEVNHLLDNPGIDDPALMDMTDLAFVTIDNEDSRDLDQAMYIRTDDHGYTVYYALADAAFYIPTDSALFANALLRGASYYLPEFSVPMLPSALSEGKGLISLNPQVLRRALVFIIRLDDKAEVIDSRIQRARILSRAKLSYNGVQAFQDDPAASPLAGQAFSETLILLKTIGEKRVDLARRRNVVEYDRMSLSVQYAGANGERFTISEDHRLDVESWNEQISLLCNHEGANLLREALDGHDIQPIFRVHMAPEPERLKKFSALLDALVAEHDLPREIWIW